MVFGKDPGIANNTPYSLHFCIGHFVVKDRAGVVFAAVAGDMKLEQSQDRFSQGPGGNVMVEVLAMLRSWQNSGFFFMKYLQSQILYSYSPMLDSRITWKRKYNMI